MQLPVFEHAYVMQSLGWAIINSIWQTGCLWLLYVLVTATDKKLPALVKHHLSLVLLGASFTWFIFTIVQNFLLLSGTDTPEPLWYQQPLLKIFNAGSLLPYLSLAYLLLLGFYLINFLRVVSGNRVLRNQGLSKTPLDFRLFTYKTALHLGIKRKVQVWFSTHVDVPCVTGLIKPVILLPAAIVNHLSVQQTEAVLLHELAHIKRQDYLVNFLQSLIEMILFFNPFALLLGKAAKRERENCCDDWVMNFQYSHYEYAKALLALEEQRLVMSHGLALAATNSKKNLLERIKRLFTARPQTNFSFVEKFKLVGLSLLLAVVIFTALPWLSGKPVTKKGAIVESKKLALVVSDQGSIENKLRAAFTIVPVKSNRKKYRAEVKPKVKNQSAQATGGDFVNAFINEELINPATQAMPVISEAAEKETVDSTFLVKIEEEQSGKKQTNTYYFELKNRIGNAAIKPLMLLNKIHIPIQKTVLKKLSDTLGRVIRLNIRRVTS